MTSSVPENIVRLHILVDPVLDKGDGIDRNMVIYCWLKLSEMVATLRHESRNNRTEFK